MYPLSWLSAAYGGYALHHLVDSMSIVSQPSSNHGLVEISVIRPNDIELASIHTHPY